MERCQAGKRLARDGGIQEIAGDVAGQTEGMGTDRGAKKYEGGNIMMVQDLGSACLRAYSRQTRIKHGGTEWGY